MMTAAPFYQDSISQSLNAVMEERTPQLTMPVFNQATSKTTPKKPRKRKPKVKQEVEVKKEATDWAAFDASSFSVKQEGCDVPIKKLKQEKITDHLPKTKRKHDRFNGMPEEEVALRLLPDHLAENLDILIVGINPGLFAAYVGHHYAGPGNHFWKCLYLSGLIPEPMNAYDDFKLKEFGIGFTNICARTTRGSADLKKPEIQEGARILKEKLIKYKPKIAAFNGKGIYEIFVGHKKFSIGKQPEPLEGTDTVVYVMPSSSARCAQLPRAVDKVPFYEALKKLRDHIKAGKLQDLDDAEVTFPTLELKIKKEEPSDDGYIKSEQGAEGATEKKPKEKPKKRRSRKSAESTVTSGEVTTPYSGEVTHPYLASTDQNGQYMPFIKQEPGDSSQQFGASHCNLPYSTQSMHVPNTMASNFSMSQSYPQPHLQYPMHPHFRPPYSPQMTFAPTSTYNPAIHFTQSLNSSVIPSSSSQPADPLHQSPPHVSRRNSSESQNKPLNHSSPKTTSDTSPHNSPTSASSTHNSPVSGLQSSSSSSSHDTPSHPSSPTSSTTGTIQSSTGPTTTFSSPFSASTTYGQMPSFSSPTTQGSIPSSTFNPPMSQVPNYTQLQMAHMAHNGFLANMGYPQPRWNQFYPNHYYQNMGHPQISNGGNQQALNLVNGDNPRQDRDSPKGANGASGNPSSTPFIKSEPVDSGYKEYDLTQL